MPHTSPLLTQLPDQDGLIVAFDTEASGLFTDEGARVSIVSVAWRQDGDQIQSRCFPFDQGLLDKPAVKGIQPGLFDAAPNLGQAEWDELCGWLQRQQLIAHNVKYDLRIMAAGHRKWGHGVNLSDRVIWDTMVTAPIFFPAQSVALKSIASKLWGEQQREPERQLQLWLKKHKDSRGAPRYDLAPWELIGPYATLDAEQCIRLYWHQQHMLATGEIPEPYELIDREVDLALCLFRMEQRGIGFDVEGCRQAANKLRTARDQLRRQLAAKWRREPTPAAARWWFFERTGRDPILWTDNKENPRASVSIEVIQQLAAEEVEDATEYERLSSYNSALSKWYDTWPDLAGPDGRLRPNYHQTKEGGEKGKGRGTVSGRLAVERIQLQAIPHDFRLPEGVAPIRSLLVAKPGHELWEIDISQAEVRVATLVAKCEPMRQLFASGDDLHGQVAQRVFEVNPGEPGWDRWRTLAKRLTFAMLYGAGAATFANTLKQQAGIIVSQNQAKQWLMDYRSTFPEFMTLYRKAQWNAEQLGYVSLITGRRRWFSAYEQQYYGRKAMNQIIQGNVAEVMKIIKIETEYEYPGYLLHEIHDSLILEVPEGPEGAARTKLVSDLMLTILEDMFGGWDKDHPIAWKVDSKPWKDAH